MEDTVRPVAVYGHGGVTASNAVATAVAEIDPLATAAHLTVADPVIPLLPSVPVLGAVLVAVRTRIGTSCDAGGQFLLRLWGESHVLDCPFRLVFLALAGMHFAFQCLQASLQLTNVLADLKLV